MNVSSSFTRCGVFCTYLFHTPWRMSCAPPAVLDDAGRLAFAGVEVVADEPVEAVVRCLGGIVRFWQGIGAWWNREANYAAIEVVSMLNWSSASLRPDVRGRAHRRGRNASAVGACEKVKPGGRVASPQMPSFDACLVNISITHKFVGFSSLGISVRSIEPLGTFFLQLQQWYIPPSTDRTSLLRKYTNTERRKT